MQTDFMTIDRLAEGFLKEKNSKFMSYAFPVSNKEQVKEELALLKDTYPDANHHCYAYILGIEGKDQRANDDGEPSSSAGKPILRQILSKGVTNTLVVVVRYFGGKKLGVPGLIYAYGEAARLALAEAQVVKKLITTNYTCRCPFGEENQIYRIAKRLNLSIRAAHSMSEFVCSIELPLHQEEEFLLLFKDLHKIELQKIEDD